MKIPIDLGNDLIFKWAGMGRVIEKRELKSAKNNTVFGHELKCLTLGANVSVRVDQAQYDTFRKGDTILCTGHFEFYQGAAQFICDTVDIPNAPKAA